jgi:hypothetical protein
LDLPGAFHIGAKIKQRLFILRSTDIWNVGDIFLPPLERVL